MKRFRKETRVVQVEEPPICDLCGESVQGDDKGFLEHVVYRGEDEVTGPATMNLDFCGECIRNRVLHALRQLYALKTPYRDWCGPTLDPYVGPDHPNRAPRA